MATLFPQEIEEEILLRMPAKSLHRMKCVCKTWNSIICSPSFISSFNRRNSHNPKLLLLKHPHPRRLPPNSATNIHFSVSSDSFVELHSIKVPQQINNGDDDLRPIRVELVTSNSINGILCVLVYMGLSNGKLMNCEMFLWNPSTRETMTIPSSEFSGLFSGVPMVKFCCGFGVGFNRDDYRVVRVSYLNTIKPTTEVYSLRNDRWMDLSLLPRSGISSNILWASSTCTFVDGTGYWGAFSSESKDEFFVLGFYFACSYFRKINVPEECVDGRDLRYHSLWVYKGMLAISVLRFAEFESDITRHYIWVMKPGRTLGSPNWCNMFNIDLVGGPRKPVLTLGNGEVLLLGEDDGEHALYDPVTEEVKRVDISDVDTVISYTESLVSLSKLMPQDGVAVSYG